MPKQTVVLLISIIAISATASTQPAVIFSEDFESYAPGSNVAGQGGWISSPIEPGPVIVNAGFGLSDASEFGNVVNGRIDPGTANLATVSQPLAIPPSGVTVLSFDAFAVSSAPAPAPDPSNPASHLSRVSFEGSQLFGWSINIEGSLTCPGGWNFRATGPDGDLGCFDGPDARDSLVKLEIIVDADASQVFGRVFDAAGNQVFETPRGSIDISAIDGVAILHDYRRRDRGQTGAEFDNIVVTNSPGIPTCSSDVTSVEGLLTEVGLLNTSTQTVNVLTNNLNNVQTALDNGNNDTARDRMGNFVKRVINRSNFNPTNPGLIVIDEANNLVCDAANVVIGIAP